MPDRGSESGAGLRFRQPACAAETSLERNGNYPAVVSIEECPSSCRNASIPGQIADRFIDRLWHVDHRQFLRPVQPGQLLGVSPALSLDPTRVRQTGVTSVIMGSFNFTKAAESSDAENLLVIRDTALAARYLKNWQTHRDHSEAFTR